VTDLAESIVYDPFSLEMQHNPFPTYRELRERAPVYHQPDHGFYALSRYDDVLAAHLDPATFISSKGVTLEGAERGAPLLILKDPPEHEWHRRVVSRVFTPRRIGGLEPFVRQTAGDILDRFRDADHFDVVEDFSIQMPLLVISELLGIPEQHRQDVHHLADRLVTRDADGQASHDAIAAIGELSGLLAELVADRRRAPGDDVISLMIEADITDDHGHSWRMSDGELAIRFLELAFAGHETVARLVANAVVALAWYPDQRAELAVEPELIGGAVEEMLRWDPPSHYQGRWTTREVELHGVTIPADQRVILLTGSAAHDERHYPEPELFDIHRQIERPVTFGFGVHLCLGAALARLETRVAFEELLARFPDYDLIESGIARLRSGNVRGLAHLPIRTA
jgi:cytochrome P450